MEEVFNKQINGLYFRSKNQTATFADVVFRITFNKALLTYTFIIKGKNYVIAVDNIKITDEEVITRNGKAKTNIKGYLNKSYFEISLE